MTFVLNEFTVRRNCIISVCDATPLAREPYAAGFVPFVNKDLEKRTSPAATLQDVKSIILIGCGNDNPESTQPGVNNPKKHLAELSSLGQNTDYHTRVKALLIELVKTLKKSRHFNHRILVDNPGLDERALAVRAGLGFYGRHGLVVSPRFGSRFHIGCLLTDIPLKDLNLPETRVDSLKECPPDCNRCISSCPTGALKPDGKFDVSRCISYLTQKDTLTLEEEGLLVNQLYGCDICQDACPFNAPRGKTWVDPHDWLAMSDDAFARLYGHTAMMWRGAEVLRRNARVVIKNRS
ncbi:MAG: DUF1730 domain-containing protein [Defluviitaleaceae bacterium]|nr:DUF1730 domain-containing protein [Defluviitaleaceae bacterium]